MKFQLVIYGATGFTGRLAVEYFARTYSGSGWNWAIAGRDETKLKALAAGLRADFQPEIIVADADRLLSKKHVLVTRFVC